ncbi:hypothetical protein [Collimonas fungivorans]|nr:hypothetical protein [Collimonas fungivorans]
MNMLLPRLLLCLAVCSLSAMPACADTTVRSLSKVRGAIKTADARAAFDREMSGAPAPDGFGQQLPDGFTKDFLVLQLAPGRDPNRVVLAGAKPWPQRPGMYVGVVCLAASPGHTGTAQRYPVGDCAGFDEGRDNEIWFGVFERGADSVPRLVARTDAPVAVPTDWSTAGSIDVPPTIDSGDGKGAVVGLPQNWQRFDLAPYLLRDGDYAFGVRAGWFESYAGGGASFEALYLFHIEGKSLRVVFAQPMMFNQTLAGEWHKDGTRSHDVSEGSNSLVVLSGVTGGFHDLQLRERGGKSRQTFQWSEKMKFYEAQ